MFLKPTKGKIIITLILFALIEYFSVYPLTKGGQIFCKCAVGVPCNCPILPFQWKYFILFSLIALIFSYFIASFILWIFSLFKKDIAPTNNK